MRVCRMGLVSQGVDDEQITITIKVQHFLGHFTKIGCVTDRLFLMLETKSSRGYTAVRLINITDRNIANFDGAYESNAVTNGRIIFVAFKCIGETMFQTLKREWPRVGGDRFTRFLENCP